MNSELVRSFLLRRLRNPWRMTLFSAYLIATVTPYMFGMADPASPGSGIIVAFILGAGMIAQDRSSGALSLILTRPITRGEYVWSRFCGFLLASAIAVAVQAVLIAGVLASKHASISPGLLARAMASPFIEAAGVGSVLLLLSSAGRGLSELAAWTAVALAMLGLGTFGQFGHVTLAQKASQAVAFVLNPGYNLVNEIVVGSATWKAPVAYVLVVGLSLLGAIAITKRRDVSYASS